MKTYYQTIKEYAKDFVDEYKDEIIEIVNDLSDKGYEIEEIINYLYDEYYLDDKIIEYLDNYWYGFLRSEFCDDCKTELSSAIKIIEESENEETDDSLWDGMSPEDAVLTKAFWTTRNDLAIEVKRLVETLVEEEVYNREKEEEEEEIEE
ncbi:MAG: hypothetical protein ACPLZ9_03970 [Candidatus Ratteibacteria bacterium]